MALSLHFNQLPNENTLT